MKRKTSVLFTGLLSAAFCLCTPALLNGHPLAAAAAEDAASSSVLLETSDPFASQASIDEALLAEAQNGYSFEEPAVILNPYGTSPLTAVIVFTTEEEVGGTVTVKGKSPENDITGTFPAAREHIVPIYGLYNGDTTEVELTLENGTTNTVEVTTEKTEINVGTITAEMIDDSSYDYGKLTLICPAGTGLYAVDAAGDIRWYYTGGASMGVHQLKNGHLMTPTTYTIRSTYYKSGLQEVDLSGKIYREYAIPGGMHHDFQELPNGNLLVASDSPDLTSVEDYVVEIDRETGEVVWELDLKDLLDLKDGISVTMETDGSEEIDWFHNNSLWYDEANDLILLSARHKDSIVAVNKSDKTLAWILGDPEGWEITDPSLFFTPVGEDFEWQYAQHQVTMLDNGDIMLFDNGSAKVKDPEDENRASGDNVYSRAVIYRINMEDMTIEQIYQYGKERGPEWYSDWISGVVSLDGTQDQLLVTAGSNLYSPEEDSHDFGPTGMMTSGLVKSTHIDLLTEGNLAFELVISGDTASSLTYRSLSLPLYTEGAALDVTAKGELLGGLGVTPVSQAEFSSQDLENAGALASDSFSFTLDPVKLSLTGLYETQEAADSLKDAYLILKCDDEVKAYSLTQYGSEGESATKVSVSGWVSIEGLEGHTYQIYLSLDENLWETGNTLEI